MLSLGLVVACANISLDRKLVPTLGTRKVPGKRSSHYQYVHGFPYFLVEKRKGESMPGLVGPRLVRGRGDALSLCMKRWPAWIAIMVLADKLGIRSLSKGE